jgi:hypothetical protein
LSPEKIYEELIQSIQNQQEEFDNSEIRVYPNPTSESVNIEIPNLKELASISIFDLTGRLVLTIDSYEILTKIDVSNLNEGTFVLKIMTSNITKTVKFVKQ